MDIDMESFWFGGACGACLACGVFSYVFSRLHRTLKVLRADYENLNAEWTDDTDPAKEPSE